ncbi:MAG: hypothetical protein ACXVZX_07920 [Terriglobales bacterium]
MDRPLSRNSTGSTTKLRLLDGGALAGYATAVLVAVAHDFSAPYSGAADMAQFLQEIGAERDETSAFTYYPVSIQAYFDHNIFTNWPTAYVHHSQDSEPPLAKLRDTNLTHYLVIPSLNGDMDLTGEDLIRRHGYIRLHVSPGRVLCNRGVWMTETFTLYEKVR